MPSRESTEPRMAEKTREYSNGEITIIWQPDLCIHSTCCYIDLPAVFRPEKRPWVNPHGATTQEIIAQIERCPSGALSYRWNKRDSG
jgi:uncharacterized Fe-S cluster protein YjdI